MTFRDKGNHVKRYQRGQHRVACRFDATRWSLVVLMPHLAVGLDHLHTDPLTIVIKQVPEPTWPIDQPLPLPDVGRVWRCGNVVGWCVHGFQSKELTSAAFEPGWQLENDGSITSAVQIFHGSG